MPDWTRETVREKVHEIIANQLSVEKSELSDDTSFTEDLNADSLDLVELVMALEEEFTDKSNPVEISDQEAERIQTVGLAIEFICEKLEIE